MERRLFITDKGREVLGRSLMERLRVGELTDPDELEALEMLCPGLIAEQQRRNDHWYFRLRSWIGRL